MIGKLLGVHYTQQWFLLHFLRLLRFIKFLQFLHLNITEVLGPGLSLYLHLVWQGT
jgi:hypothetical protein